MAGNFKSLTDDNFESEIESGVVLVDFYADWCGPCRMMTPVLEEFAQKKTGKVSVAKVDIDTNPTVTQKYQVTAVPTLILFKDGEPVGTYVGLKDYPQLESLVNSSLA